MGCRKRLCLVSISRIINKDRIERIISINNEMEKFDINLKKTPQVLVINKIDLEEVSVLKQEIINEIEESNINHKPIFISAITSEGINNLVDLITEEINRIRDEVWN